MFLIGIGTYIAVCVNVVTGSMLSPYLHICLLCSVMDTRSLSA